MHLVAPLAAGIAGASLGTASLFKRGTATRATWYASFEGDSPNSTGADITLDSSGAVVAFVNELVTVVVKNSAGVEVSEFTAGDSAAAVEVISDSFIGTDYDDAETGTNKPITLLEILNKVNDSFGSTNWNVMVGGSSVSVQNALAGTSLFVNVKAPQFGATGDGTTDDTAAINAAIFYAFTVRNATVYFPPGTYRITDSLVLSAGVNLLGSGVNGTELASTIARSTSSFNAVEFDGLAASEAFIQRLIFSDADTGTNQPFVAVQVDSTCTMEHCVFEAPANAATNGSPIFSNGSGKLNLKHCVFTLRGAQGRIVGRTGAALNHETVMYGCTVDFAGNLNYATTFGLNGICRLFGNIFHTSFTTGLVPPTQLVLPYLPSTIFGNKWTSAISDTIVALSADGSAGAGTENVIVEAGNSYAANFFVTGQNNGNMLAQSLASRRSTFTIGAPGTVSILATGGTVIVTTTGAAGTYVLAFPTTGVPRWSKITLIVRNTSANNHTLDFTGTSPADTGVALNAATRSLRAIYEYTTDGTTTSWFRMTGFTVVAP